MGEIYKLDEIEYTIDEEEFVDPKKLEENPCFGPFCFFAVIPWMSAPILKILPLLVWSSQWILIIGLGISSWNSYSSGWCPRIWAEEGNYTVISPNASQPAHAQLLEGDALLQAHSRSALMFAISIFLFFKTVVRAHKYVDGSFSMWKCEKFCKSWLFILGLFDCTTEIAMDSSMVILNIFIVFIAEKPVDMVLNSVALEFIAEADNQLKIFMTSRKDKDAGWSLKKQILLNLEVVPSWSVHRFIHPGAFFYDAFNGQGCQHHPAMICCWLTPNFSALFLVYITPVIVFACAIYGPICKP
jgi:hypothetical protein